jgi:uncharacterized membrane protein (UPF0127 family)
MEVTTLRVVNLSTGTEIANYVSTADNFFKRLKGLMFTKCLHTGHGLYIKPCQSIHTFFMNYPIDVLYLSEQLEVVGMDEAMQPGAVGKYQRKAFSVLELPAGTIQETKTRIGHYLSIK